RSILCVVATVIALACITQVKLAVDVAEDQRNSFSLADQRQLATLTEPLVVTVHLAPEDPRYVDLRRNVLAKLERAMPNVTVRLPPGQKSQAASAADETYGIVEYVYGSRSDVSRSTSLREILPMLYGLAGVAPPSPLPGGDYPGYPLVADASFALVWFF